MGLSYSCQLFEKFSSALHWVLNSKFYVEGCVHILDDFLFLGPPGTPICRNALSSFYQLANEIGVPIREEKTVLPTTCLVFLGVEIDSVMIEIRLPIEKLVQMRSTVSNFSRRKKITLRELQSLIGLLNFACNVVVPGRTL